MNTEVTERSDTKTTTEKTRKQESALAKMATSLQVSQANLIETLKSTCFKGAKGRDGKPTQITNEQFTAMVIVAAEYNLNPFTKEIYAFDDGRGGIVPVVGIDGWARLVNEHAQFDGLEFEFEDDDKGGLVSCQCTIFRKDRTRPTRVIEYLSECKRPTDPWKNMPRRMLRHKALIQCARIAFSLGGIHDNDEAYDIIDGPMRDITPVDAAVEDMNAQIKASKPAKLAAKAAPEPENVMWPDEPSSNDVKPDQSEPELAAIADQSDPETGELADPVSFASVLNQLEKANSLQTLAAAEKLIDLVREDQQHELRARATYLGGRGFLC